MLRPMRLTLAVIAAVLLGGCGSVHKTTSRTGHFHDLSETFDTAPPHAVHLSPAQRAALIRHIDAECRRHHEQCPSIPPHAPLAITHARVIKPNGERESLQAGEKEIALCRDSPKECPSVLSLQKRTYRLRIK